MSPRKAKKKEPVTAAQKRVDLGPETLVEFSNLENPGAALDFTFEGRKYHIEDGQQIKLPAKTIWHLNHLTTDKIEWVKDAKTGVARSQKTGVNHRFSCVPMELYASQPQEPPGKEEGATA